MEREEAKDAFLNGRAGSGLRDSEVIVTGRAKRVWSWRKVVKAWWSSVDAREKAICISSVTHVLERDIGESLG